MINESVVATSGQREFMVVAHTGRAVVTRTVESIARHCAAAGVGLRIIDHDLTADNPATQDDPEPVSYTHLTLPTILRV